MRSPGRLDASRSRRRSARPCFATAAAAAGGSDLGVLPCSLALRGRDPDEVLRGRLRELTPGIRPLSHSRVTARAGVLDRATKAPPG